MEKAPSKRLPFIGAVHAKWKWCNTFQIPYCCYKKQVPFPSLVVFVPPFTWFKHFITSSVSLLLPGSFSDLRLQDPRAFIFSTLKNISNKKWDLFSLKLRCWSQAHWCYLKDDDDESKQYYWQNSRKMVIFINAEVFSGVQINVVFSF